MTTPGNGAPKAVLDQLLADNGFTPETRLYREVLMETLSPTEAAGVYRLAANAAPSEAVIDVYGQGHLVQAEQVGPGLAFAQSTRPDWQETMELRVLKAGAATREHLAAGRMEVELRLGDVLAQGGLVYPVESVTVEKAWYCTLPSGSVTVREVL